MPKPMYVWSGSAWVSVASEVESLANFATQSYADNTPAMRMVVPSSVTVGSGTGSANTAGYVTFTGVSSVSLNDVFSSTYDSYKIVTSFKSPSADSGIDLRFRVSGADNSTSNYIRTCQHTSTGGITNRSDTGTLFDLVQTDSGTSEGYGYTLELQNPFLTEFTKGQIITNGVFGTGVRNTLAGGLLFSATTSFTGFTILASSGTFSGTVAVYGYKD